MQETSETPGWEDPLKEGMAVHSSTLAWKIPGMASPTRWTWVWVNSGSWWWTGRPGVLQSMGSQRFRHNWATELKWTLPILPYLGSKPQNYYSVILWTPKAMFLKGCYYIPGGPRWLCSLTLFDVLKARYLFYFITFHISITYMMNSFTKQKHTNRHRK